MNIIPSIETLIGHTPLVRLDRLTQKEGAKATLLAKLESFNPGGSTKDRAALYMINEAEKSGKLTKDSVIIEPTSGNTGIGLAMVASVRGYRAMIVMPETMSIERRRLMSAYGAEIVLSEGAKGMKGAIEKATQLANEIPHSFMPMQFENLANPEAHRQTTGPEIWADTEGKVDVLVAGVGTGGTITGVGEYLKSQNPDIRVVAVEPKGSPVLSGGQAGPHGIQGIGAGFIPKALSTEVIDEVITVENEQAFQMSRSLGKTEGILVGISSGAALYAGMKLAKMDAYAGKNIVVMLPDTGERYLSTALFE